MPSFYMSYFHVYAMKVFTGFLLIISINMGILASLRLDTS